MSKTQVLEFYSFFKLVLTPENPQLIRQLNSKENKPIAVSANCEPPDLSICSRNKLTIKAWSRVFVVPKCMSNLFRPVYERE
jgi:hypothetical protein